MSADWADLRLEPLTGGFSGETFVSRSPDGEVVVRVYGRDPERAVVDAALLQLVTGLLPVPRVLELRRSVDGLPGILVTERLAGVPLDVAVDESPAVDWSALGHSVGRVVATLSGMPQVRAGLFHDADLVPQAGSLPGDLHEWVDRHRDSGLFVHWDQYDWAALTALVQRAQDVLDAGTDRTVLVHSDLNLKNLLVDPDSWQVTGVLDWEFAHAGSPDADLGNLTRFEREPAFLAALLDEVDSGPGPSSQGNDALLRGRALDLWATVDLAARDRSTTVSRLAERLLLAQARSGDLEAWPFEGARISVPTARLGEPDGEPLS